MESDESDEPIITRPRASTIDVVLDKPEVAEHLLNGDVKPLFNRYALLFLSASLLASMEGTLEVTPGELRHYYNVMHEFASKCYLANYPPQESYHSPFESFLHSFLLSARIWLGRRMTPKVYPHFTKFPILRC